MKSAKQRTLVLGPAGGGKATSMLQKKQSTKKKAEGLSHVQNQTCV